ADGRLLHGEWRDRILMPTPPPRQQAPADPLPAGGVPQARHLAPRQGETRVASRADVCYDARSGERTPLRVTLDGPARQLRGGPARALVVQPADHCRHPDPGAPDLPAAPGLARLGCRPEWRGGGGGRHYALPPGDLLLHPASRIRPYHDGASLRGSDPGSPPVPDRRPGPVGAHAG